MSVKFLGIQVKNIGKIGLLKLELKKDGLQIVKGENRSGKSTLHKAIELLFKGVKAVGGAKNVEGIIKDGKERAEIIGVFDNFTVRKVFTKANPGGVPQIKFNDGTPFTEGNKQEFMNLLYNEITFNLRKFFDQKESERAALVCEVAGIDFDPIKRKIKNLEEDRVLAGRRVKALGEIEEVEEIKEVDIEELTAEMQKLAGEKDVAEEAFEKTRKEDTKKVNDFNTEQRELKTSVDGVKSKISTIASLKEGLEESKATLEEKLKQTIIDINKLEERKKKGEEILAGLKKPEDEKSAPEYVKFDFEKADDLKEIETKIINAGSVNRKYLEYSKYLEKKLELDEANEEYKSYTTKIEDFRKEKLEMGTLTGFIDGLTVEDGVLYHKGIESERWSEEETMTIAAEIFKAKQPECKTIFLDRGESYDPKSLKKLEKWCEKNGIDVILFSVAGEKPKNINPGEFWLEEGNLFDDEGNTVSKIKLKQTPKGKAEKKVKPKEELKEPKKEVEKKESKNIFPETDEEIAEAEEQRNESEEIEKNVEKPDDLPWDEDKKAEKKTEEKVIKNKIFEF